MMVFGLLLSALIAASLLAASQASASTTFTVNSTEDHSDAVLTVGACDTGYTVTGAGGEPEVECTLRAAMEQANYTAGADTINFAIPGSGVKTIAPTSQLPTITGPVSINGYSQPGAQPNTKAVGSDAVLKIELSGAQFPGSGLVIGAANSTVKGLVINNWTYVGIRIDGSGATGSRVTGNYLGTDASGTQKLGNGQGIRVYYGSNNTIGGTTAAERNVISGNSNGGVSLGDGGVVENNRVVGNYIGTDKTGTKALGNALYGVSIEEAPGTTIGGATAGTRNVISGNDGDGVAIFSQETKVLGNYIGTDASGTKNLGNQQGVRINDANNTVGGTEAGARNVISGNFVGVNISGAAATGNKVVGNYVGTDKNGTAPMANAVGVHIFEASNNTVGGTEAGARNVISASLYDGVSIRSGAAGNRVLSNSIYSNGEQGIDLGDDGPTANDPGDADTGPNGLQNKPAVRSAKTGALKTTVSARLNSTPNRTFTVQFFSNPSGTDEGKQFLGQKSVTTDGSGNAVFSFTPAQKVGVGRTVTATATNPAGSTSEFSTPRTVTSP